MAFTTAQRDALVANPVDFLNEAAIMVSHKMTTATHRNQAEALTLRPQQGDAYRQYWVGDHVHMKRVPYFLLTKADGDAVTFQGYIVDYAQGATTATTLGTAADLCFTANMNGCTFGIGSAAPGGSRVVTHGNAAGHAGLAGLQKPAVITAIQSSIQHTEARNALGAGAQVFEPEHYRTNGKMSITFGWRKGGQWGFYYLAYIRSQGRITTYGTRPVDTNVIVADNLVGL